MDTATENIRNLTIAGLTAEIERGIAMIEMMSDDEYATARGGGSSVGAHIRHNLDFVNAVLNGVAVRRIDYNDRTRDTRIETDRDYAVREMAFAVERLDRLTPAILATLVLVRSEVDEDLWHTSTVSREIEFLHSHTVHHYALVRFLMAESREVLSPSFGVSPSTLRFRCEAPQGITAPNF
jgi:hypothetical protein